MAITDLTGTTWYFNDTLIIDSEQNYEYDIDFTTSVELSGYTQFIALNLQWQGYLYYRVDSSRNIAVYSNSTWGSEDCRTISITGGDDVANTDIISWLEANATQVIPELNYVDKTVLLSGDEYYFKDTISGYLSSSDLVAGTNISIEEDSEGKAVISSSSNARVRIIRLPEPLSNLTGTTWYFNDTLSSIGLTGVAGTYVSYSINFTDLNGNEYIAITGSSNESYPDDVYYRNSSNQRSIVYDSEETSFKWKQSYYRTINITSGTDVTNTALISWLEANATQVS